MAQQLELFATLDRRAPAEILVFPPHRMRVSIRLAANRVTLSSTPRRELDRQVRLYRTWLTDLAVPRFEIERSVARYRVEIVCELMRRRHVGRRIEGDAA